MKECYKGRADKRVMRLLVMGLAALLLAMTIWQPPPAKAQAAQENLAKTGPINPDSGYPYWYEDANGLRLDLCLDPQDQKCLQPFEMPNPDAPVSFPDNFPGEAFYWTGEAATTTTSGADALLVMALEAAFANDEVVDGDQMTFGRIRIRIDNLKPGATYRVSHPYGTDTYEATDKDGDGIGDINVTEDIGCFPTGRLKCDFDDARSSRIGPFLTWDTFGDKTDPALAGANGEPDAYVGDPAVEGGHLVKGSPVNDAQGSPQNYFKIEQKNADGTFEQIGATDMFAVSGKVAAPQVNASPREEVFNEPQDVTLVPSDSAYEVYYTNDPAVADADIATAGTRYDPNQPIHLEGVDGQVEKTTLRFLAVDPASGQQSSVMEKTYTIDRDAPNLSADPASGVYETAQTVTLSSNDALAKIYYTTDGSSPVGANGSPTGTEYTAPFDVNRSQKVKAVAVDEAGNKSQVKTFNYTISSLSAKGPINPQGGYPFWYQDANGVKLDLCLDPQDQMCLQPFEMPNPDAPVSFPDNFPGEAFWFAGDALTTTNTGADAQLVLALEAAWANEEPVDGDQMSFGRVRVRVDDLVIGQKYRVTHPYGVDTYTATDDGKGSGEINVTEDIGCFPTARLKCDFDDARFGRVGPFLTWDTFGNPDPALAPPAGYVGDPTVEGGHKVTGSPLDSNFFKVEKVNTDGTAQQVAFTDMFNISGKLAKLQASPSVKGGFYNTSQNVELVASEEGSQIFYTLDGSDPTTGSTLYSGPIAIDAMNAETTLKFIAVDAAGNQSEVFTETYTLDNIVPTVSSSVEPGTYNAAQNIALTSEEGAKIYFTTDGSAPTDQSTLYDAPIRVDSPTTIKAIAIDRAGNISEVASFAYDVQIPDTTLDLDVNRNVLTFGQTAVLSGKLAASDPASAVSGKQLIVEERPAGADSWTRARGGTTADDGGFRLGVRPDLNTAYRVRFAGDDTLRASTSPARQVNVRTDVSQNLSRNSLPQGGKVAISGSVAPDHTGSVQLVIRRGTQVVARPNVRLRGSSYRFVYQPRAAGNYNVRTVFAGHDDHLAGSSGLDRFQVNPR